MVKKSNENVLNGEDEHWEGKENKNINGVNKD